MARQATNLSPADRNQRTISWALMGSGAVIFAANNIIYNLYQSQHVNEWIFSALFISFAVDALSLVMFVVGAMLAYALAKKQRSS